MVPKAARKSSFQCTDAVQVSVCITFTIVLLAKESLLAKPSTPVAGRGYTEGKNLCSFCNCTADAIKGIIP